MEDLFKNRLLPHRISEEVKHQAPGNRNQSEQIVRNLYMVLVDYSPWTANWDHKPALNLEGGWENSG